MRVLKVYLDSCVLNRLSDAKGQDRIRIEAQAVERLLVLTVVGRVRWIASRAFEVELLNNPDLEKRDDALELLAYAESTLLPSPAILGRSEVFGAAGYGAFDALHLAFAEEAGVDVLLTTDDRFVRLAARGAGEPLVRVLNPVDWLDEVRDGSD